MLGALLTETLHTLALSEAATNPVSQMARRPRNAALVSSLSPHPIWIITAPTTSPLEVSHPNTQWELKKNVTFKIHS